MHATPAINTSPQRPLSPIRYGDSLGLFLLRLHMNWCKPGNEGHTSAMRLGLAERPLELTEVLETAGEDMSIVREAQAILDKQRVVRGGHKARKAETFELERQPGIEPPTLSPMGISPF